MCTDSSDDNPQIMCEWTLIPRWTYNSNTKQCKTHSEVRCRSQNRYESQKDCIGICGPCGGDAPVLGMQCLADHPERFWYNSTANQCQSFVYGGCDGVANSHKTEENCRGVCSEPCGGVEPAVGTCEDRIPRRWYNSTSNKCEKFYYSGCGGTRNNFKTKSSCVRVCKPNVRCTGSKPQVGGCDASITKWWYNATSNACQPFNYGGCGKRKWNQFNNHKSLEKCLKNCSGK